MDRPDENDRPRLSPRETEVVGLVVEGLSNAAAATRLGLSVRTVQSHVANALDKTGTRSRVQLAVFALCHDMVRCPCGELHDHRFGISAD